MIQKFKRNFVMSTEERPINQGQPASPEDPLYDTPGPDLSKLSPQELRLYKLYGKLPKTSQVLQERLKDRKFFDSGDYMMSKASGKPNQGNQVGSINPLRAPDIENMARINRNSFSGSTAPSVLGLNQQKSKLEEDSTEAVLSDDE